MRRHFVGVIVLGLLAVGLWRLPTADPARVAALRTSEILGAQVEGPDGALSLGERLLASSSVRRGDDGDLILWLDGVRVLTPLFPSEDLDLHGLGRRSLIAGLRSLAAERGETLQVAGELWPSKGGLNVLVTLEEQGFGLEAASADGTLLSGRLEGWRPPRRWSLYPPLLAIALAVLFRRPILALFAGVWCAAFLLRYGAGELGPAAALLRSLPDVGTRLLWPQLTDPMRLEIMGFVFAMLAMIGVMTRSGGVRGLMDLVARMAHNARRTQIATWLMGLVVFFDDYANCILVGTTMRPLTDRFRVSREKLAYLVDSTAAPVAGISIFSTWIAFEVSTFSAQLPAAGMSPAEGYAVFLQTLPYRFYCILTLFFSGLLAFSGRDLGPMLTAERRARRTGQVVRAGGRPMVSERGTDLAPAPGMEPRARNALVPLAVFIGLTLLEIVRVGFTALRAEDAQFGWSALLSLQGVTGLLGQGDSTRALLVGSSAGFLAAAALALAAGLGAGVLRAAWSTLRSMGVAIAILYLAWMIGAACDGLGTAPYLTALVGENLPAELLPAILFLMSAAVAFATGSSWSTMSILLPLVVGMSFSMGETSDLGGKLLMAMSIGAVLEGSIFGDHCSPISDTTVLSSTASAADHIDHVRTQMPYALLVMAVALGLGYMPCAFSGAHPLVSLAGAAALLAAIVFLLGKRADDARLTDAS
jgi:Na+/H+ antiporter NhaC